MSVERIAGTFRVVPRHLFASEVSLETAYAANRSVVTKRDENGAAVSSVSAPSIQVTMLEQAELRPGMRVLEIGSGGYNAALIAELVGGDGEVVTVDIDHEVVDRARRCLAAAGYDEVNVVLADAENGVPDYAPYDRIIVTASAWNIPSAWSDQLAEGGRLVVPLRLRGLTRSIVFEREAGQWVSRGHHHLCGFVPMQGTGAHQEELVLIHGDDVGLRIDGEHSLDADRLGDALAQQRVIDGRGLPSGEWSLSTTSTSGWPPHCRDSAFSRRSLLPSTVDSSAPGRGGVPQPLWSRTASPTAPSGRSIRTGRSTSSACSPTARTRTRSRMT